MEASHDACASICTPILVHVCMYVCHRSEAMSFAAHAAAISSAQSAVSHDRQALQSQAADLAALQHRLRQEQQQLDQHKAEVQELQDKLEQQVSHGEIQRPPCLRSVRCCALVVCTYSIISSVACRTRSTHKHNDVTCPVFSGCCSKGCPGKSRSAACSVRQSTCCTAPVTVPVT